MQKGFSTLLTLLLLIVLGFTVFFLLRNSPQPGDLSGVKVSEEKDCHPKLDYRLCKLIESGNPEKFAKDNDLDLQGDRVIVTIELLDRGYTLPEEYGVELQRTSTGGLLQARIKIDKLIEAANNPSVRNIRTPLKPIPD